MTNFLITGPTGFLGYHVIKRLNEQGNRPRVLLPRDADASSPRVQSLSKLQTESCEGDFADPASLQAACDGIDVVLHLHFAIGLGAGDEIERSLHEGNVVATRNLLDAAARAGVKRVVVSSSSLAVGLNREPAEIDESADWKQHAFRLPYALSRREAEQAALARNSDEMEIVAVNPSFTMGPDDYVGAPANGLAVRMKSKWFRLNPPIGFGILDVRDYAAGVLGAADRGVPGTRYLLSGTNLNAKELSRAVAAAIGAEPPGWFLPVPLWVMRPILAVLNLRARLRGKPPAVSPAILELFGRHAWYDTSGAREAFDWQPRPLSETLKDTLDWMSEHPAADT
ncbi:MAG: NAD-dependent epimerase/dehydratase family protein [Kiloniellales bacterium]|nr:NAD-dependent epimerase/dehydratase family protein [Kiloniellales bacterium]